MYRDIRRLPQRAEVRAGRRVVAVIGIDRYREWSRLENAVNDAVGASRLFLQLGFEEVTAPLVDEAATGAAMRRLVTDDLAQLSPDDSLVLFFAGHGHTHLTTVGSVCVKTGYVIPVDAAHPRGHVSASWLRLDGWLSDIARLPPRHILMLVDSCHSGIALSASHRWRDEGSPPGAAQAALHARRSRRIIASALDDQRALDSGPVPGHSLFTGCLIEALSGGLADGGRRVTTGRALGQYLQKRVASYPQSAQTPDFSTFELDDRGDIVLPILPEPLPGGRVAVPAWATSSGPDEVTWREPSGRTTRPVATNPGVGPPPPPPRHASTRPAVQAPRHLPRQDRRSGRRRLRGGVVAALLVLGAGGVAVGYVGPRTLVERGPEREPPPDAGTTLPGDAGTPILVAAATSRQLEPPPDAEAAGPGDAATLGVVTPTAQTIDICIDSTPRGAAIYVDGSDTGKVTPAALSRDRRPGASISITLRRKGYHSVTLKRFDLGESSFHRAVLIEVRPPAPIRPCVLPDLLACPRDARGCCKATDPDGLLLP